jgi:F420H(2)-dependent quinone reductase
LNNARHSDPAERNALMRLFYRNWRPTRLGRWVNRFTCWWSGLGLPPRFQAVLEVQGRTSGRRRSNPVVIATVKGRRYLVSMLGPGSDWVKNVEAAHGDAVIRRGRCLQVRCRVALLIYARQLPQISRFPPPAAPQTPRVRRRIRADPRRAGSGGRRFRRG